MARISLKITENPLRHPFFTFFFISRETHGYEYSVVDPKARTMEMTSINLTFCNFVSMKEKMKYAPHPDDPCNKTLMTSEMIVTVRNVPLTTYMER